MSQAKLKSWTNGNKMEINMNAITWITFFLNTNNEWLDDVSPFERDIEIDFNCIFPFVCPLFTVHIWIIDFIMNLYIAHRSSINSRSYFGIFMRSLNVLTTVVSWTCRYRCDFKSILNLLDTPTAFSIFWSAIFKLASHVNDFFSMAISVWQLNNEHK